MFMYSDPTGTGHLQQSGALQPYREAIAFLEQRLHERPGSAYTLREALGELAPSAQAQVTAVSWSAFPVTAAAAASDIDRLRFRHQDEYVEWRAETQAGALTRVTFTTEFTEYFAALAHVGADALKREIRALDPGAAPSDAELFGAGFNPNTATPRTRANAFVAQLRRNPWNNGERGILCLSHGSNTLSALFGLLGECGVPQPAVNPGEVCANVGGSCVPGRNSDPTVCSAAQGLALADRSFSLQDPCGIRIVGLNTAGVWTEDGQVVDVNDQSANRGIWTVTRNGRRATFTFTGDIRLNGATVTTGAELSQQLFVAADVIHARNADLPPWARRGNEHLTRSSPGDGV
jgi:hypothetical protein